MAKQLNKQIDVNLNVSADTGNAQKNLQQLQATINKLVTTPANLTIGGQLKKDIGEASKELAHLQANLSSSTNALTGNLNLTKFNQQMKSAGLSMEQYKNALTAMGPAGQQAFSQLANSVMSAEIPIKRSNAQLKEMMTTLQNTIRWKISQTAINAIVGGIQSAYYYAKDLNESLNNIRIVTGQSTEQMAQFAKQANAAAKALSTTTTAYTDASLIYYQQGLSTEEVQKRTEVTIKMANVSGQTAEKVSDQMTAVWNNFAKGSQNLEHYADVMTALGAATASSSEEIATGLNKFASVADTIGLSYENAAAALATITATTRNSADTVGTGLRTLFSRFQSISLGETLDDGVTLTKYSNALKKVGVDVVDASGNLRKMDDIIEDLGGKWESLSKAQQTALAQTVGGVRQYTNLVALMDNFDFYKQNQNTANNSDGTLNKQAEIYEESWRAASKRVQASLEQVYSDLLNDEFLIKITNGFAKGIDVVDDFIDSLGGVKGVLLAIGSLVTTVFAKQTTAALSGFISNTMMIFPSVRREAEELQNSTLKMLQSNYNYHENGIGTPIKDQVDSALESQYRVQQSYLELQRNPNASEMNKMMGKSLTQQQEAVTKDILNSADQAANARDKAMQARYNTTSQARLLGINRKDLSSLVSRESGKDLYRIQQAFQSEDLTQALDAGNIDAYKAKLQELKITEESLKGVFGEGSLVLQDYQAVMNNTGDIDQQIAAISQLQEEMQDAGFVTDELKQHFRDVLTSSQSGIDIIGLTDAQVENLVNSLYEEVQAGASAEEALEKLRQKTQQAGATAQENAKNIQTLGQSVRQIGQGFVDVTGGLMSLGMAISTVKGLWSTLNDETKSSGDKIISVMTGLGSAAMMLANVKWEAMVSGIKAIGAAFSANPILFAVAGGIAALVVGGMALAKAIETDKEKTERLNRELESVNNNVSTLRNNIEEMTSGKDAHDNLLNKLSTLTEGTKEFKDTLAEANEQAKQLIALGNFEYGKDYTITNGQYVINDEAYSRYLQQQNALEKQMSRTQAFQSGATQADTIKNDSTAAKTLKEVPYTAGYDAAFVNNDNQYFSAQELIGNFSKDTLSGNYSGTIENYIKDKGYSLTYNNGNNTPIDVLNEYLNTNSKDFGGDAPYANVTDLNDIANRYTSEATAGYSQLLEDIASSDDGEIDLIEKYAIDRSRQEALRLGQLAENGFISDEFKTDYEAAGKDYDQMAKNLGITVGENETAKDLVRARYKEQRLEKYYNDQIKELWDNKDGAIDGIIQSVKDFGTKTRTEQQNLLNEWQGEGQPEAVQYFAQNLQSELDKQDAQLAELGIESSDKLGNNLTGNQISDITNKMIAVKGQYGKTAALRLGDIMTAINGGSYNQEIANGLAGLDVSSPLKYLDGLRKAASDMSEDNAEIVNAYADLIRDTTGKAGLLESLYGTEEFKDGLESLQKIFAETGKVGGKDVLSVAKNCDILNTFLDETNVTATALGKTIELLGSDGAISIESLTNGFLSAISTATGLENAVDTAFNHIDNFTQSRSGSEVDSFMEARVKTVKEKMEAGYLGDDALYENYAEIFGQEEANRLRDNLANWSNQEIDINEEFNNNYAQEIAAMQSIQERGNLSGLWEYWRDNGKANSDIGSVADNLTFNNDGTIDTSKTLDGKTSEEVKQWIKDVTGNDSNDYAEMLLTELTANNAGFKANLTKNDAKVGLEKFDEANKINKDQIKEYYDNYKEYLDDAGDDFESWYEDYKEKHQSDGKIWEQSKEDYRDEETGKIDFDKMAKDRNLTRENDNINYTESGKDATYKHRELYSAIQNAQEKISGDAMTKVTGIDDASKEITTFTNNADTAIQTLKSMGATEEEAQDKMRELFEDSKGAQNWSQTVTNAYGETKEYIKGANESWDEFQARIKASVSEDELAHSAEVQAKAFAQAFLDNPVEIDTTDAQNSLIALTNKAKDAAKAVASIPNAPGGSSNEPGQSRLGGYVPSYASGSAGRKLNKGIALTGEQGPELVYNADLGYSYMVGKKHPEFTVLRPGDRIFNNRETQQIINGSDIQNHEIYGSYARGYQGITWGSATGNSSSGGASSSNVKSSNYEPERYHLITRQINDLNRLYNQLSKEKDRAYGTNKLDAINREIEATGKLIDGQQALIDEINQYKDIDLSRLSSLGVDYELDEWGNLKNFEELQERYRKAAEENKDDTGAQDAWKAIQQYETTLDKWNEANEKMQELMIQQVDERLEYISTKAEIKLKFNDKDIDVLEHFLKKINDDIYETADYLALTGRQFQVIQDKNTVITNQFNDLLNNLSNSKGDKLPSLTIEQFLGMSPEQLKALDIDAEIGAQLESIQEQYLKNADVLEEYRTKGVEKVSQAFEELSKNVEDNINIFKHYDTMLKNYKNITDLLGIDDSKEYRKYLDDMDKAVIRNGRNRVKALQDERTSLEATKLLIEENIANTTDPKVIKAYEKQLDTINEKLRSVSEDILAEIESNLKKSQEIYKRTMENIAKDTDKAFAGTSGTMEEFQKDFDRFSEQEKRYVDDYERYYQLGKLERNINKDLDEYAKKGLKNTTNLRNVMADIQKAQQSGTKMSEYDLQVLEKRYELEKARADLEAARDAKSTVRLQRSANGSWGYVYTANEDNIAELEQNVEDKLYELQKLNDEHLKQVRDDAISKYTTMVNSITSILKDTEMSMEEKQRQFQKIREQYGEDVEYLIQDFMKASENQEDTVDLFTKKYGDAAAIIRNTFSELGLDVITGQESLEEWLLTALNTIDEANRKSEEAKRDFDERNKDIAGDSGIVDPIEQGEELIEKIGEQSDATRELVAKSATEMINQMREVTSAAQIFENTYGKAIQAAILQTENLATSLENVLGMLNGLSDRSDIWAQAMGVSAKDMGITDVGTINKILSNGASAMAVSSLAPTIVKGLDMASKVTQDTYNITIQDPNGDAVDALMDMIGSSPENASQYSNQNTAFNRLVESTLPTLHKYS